jgi:hypothetical protein
VRRVWLLEWRMGRASRRRRARRRPWPAEALRPHSCINTAYLHPPADSHALFKRQRGIKTMRGAAWGLRRGAREGYGLRARREC